MSKLYLIKKYMVWKLMEKRVMLKLNNEQALFNF